MSTYSQRMAAGVSEGYRFPMRGSIASSSIEAISPRGLSEKALEPLSTTTSPTSYELYDIRVELDHQCLQRAAGIHLTHKREQTPVDSVRAWAETLSGRLNQTGSPERAAFQEIQLRALVSSLALLHHSDVRTLDPAAWDVLNTNISERFQAISYQLKHPSTIAEKIRHTSNVYLVQLASQYLSFIRRGDSMLPSIVGPAIKIFFASISIVSGQYNQTQQILEGLNHLFALRQKPQTSFEALCGFQEYTRLATSLTRESSLAADRDQVREAAAVIVMTLLLKLDRILPEENSTSWPEPGSKWHKLLAAINWETPKLDRGWYYFGLLDCAAQLAALVDPSMLPKGFISSIKQLIFRKASLEYRWKAMEILLSCCGTRVDQYDILKKEIKEKPGIEAYEPGEEPREKLLQMAKTVRDHLNRDEEDGLRFHVSPPLTRPHDVDAIPSSPVTIGPSEVPEEPWKEPELDRATFNGSQTFTLPVPRSGILRIGHSYDSAGFSEDCKHAFLYNDSEISVFRLGNLQGYMKTSPDFPKTLSKQVKGECILNAVLARKFLFISTNKRLITVDTTRDVKNSQIDSIAHGDWDPSGLTCYESDRRLVVILGQRKLNHRIGYKSRLRIFKNNINSSTRMSAYPPIDLPIHDFPKTLEYDPEEHMITCVTSLQNKVIVWKVNEEFGAVMEPFEHANDEHTAETKATGVTSASIYKSPTNRLYILCTTSPSTERSRHRGEWSFILPLPTFTAPTVRPPNETTTRNLEQFTALHALRAGCVSSPHNVFAVLEETGKIFILPLEAHEEAGIHGCESDALVSLPESLCKQEVPSTSSFRFDPSGDRLFAIDPRGKIIVTDFEKQG